MRLCGSCSVLLALLWTAAVRADEPAAKPETRGLAGAWTGVLDVTPQVKLRIVLTVQEAKDGALKAKFASPDQGPTQFDADPITRSGDTLSFSVKQIGGTYKGTIDKKGTSITGKWSQAGRDFPLTFTPADPKSLGPPEAPAELAGLREGTLEVGGAKLRLVLRVEKAKEGEKLVAFLDSPDQGVNGIPVTAIALKDDQLTFECQAIGGRYEGKLDKANQTFEGKWSQGGQSFPLNLKKTEKVSEARRPQNPTGPVPYRAEEVQFRNEDAGIALGGTLTLPPGDGPFPAVVLITGSGAQDRDETIFGHKPFLVLADALTRRGIAVLRADDRGVNKSEGNAAQSTSADFAGDALAGVALLRSRPEIDPKAIGLIGHSEGGLIAPMAANRCDDVAFVVLLAGTGLTGEEIIYLQTEAILRAANTNDPNIAFQVATLKKLVAAVREGATPEAVKAMIDKTRSELSEELSASAGMLQQADTLATRFRTPWFQFFLSYDPRTDLRKLKQPVLALNGEKDLQVPPKANLPEIEKALREGGNDHVTIEEIPGVNHLFQHCKTGSPTEYGTIEETFAPEALDRIASWVLQTTGRG